jgi:subtilisin family serine protease
VPSPALAAADPTDPYFEGNGWQTRIGWSPPASTIGYPGIAVVDSGLRSDFDDFAGYLDDQSADCTAPNGVVRRMKRPVDVNDTDGHGTKVATLAAAPANGKGSVGVSPNSLLIVVRITRSGDNLAAGITCAFNYLAGVAKSTPLPLVVNVSSEFPRAPSGAKRALDRLIAAGALVVAAAGNSDGGPVQWPASADHVLAVGRDDGAGARGRKLDIVAPGAHLRLPQMSGGWASGADAGTSFSSPIVAGVAARVWGELAIENPQVVTYLLRKNAKNIGSRYGSGLVKLNAALAAGRKKLPEPEELEPNDTRPSAYRKSGCARTCALRGLVSKSDDDSDYWHLVGRSRCPKGKLRATGGVLAFCFPGHGGVFVRVRPTRPLGLYTVTVPRR